MLKGKKLVIFDFDGTLVDSMWAWRAVLPAAIERFDIDLHCTEKELSKMSMKRFSKHVADLFPDKLDADDVYKFCVDFIYNAYANEITVKKGAKEFLDYLKTTDIKICLASATEHTLLEFAAEKHGLIGYFDFIITEDDVGASKREPTIYLESIKRAGVTKEETLIFEDVIHAVRTAHAAEIPLCAVYDEGMENYKEEIISLANYYINDFTEIKKDA